MRQQDTGQPLDGNSYRHDMHLQYMKAFALRNIFKLFAFLLIKFRKFMFLRMQVRVKTDNNGKNNSVLL